MNVDMDKYSKQSRQNFLHYLQVISRERNTWNDKNKKVNKFLNKN